MLGVRDAHAMAQNDNYSLVDLPEGLRRQFEKVEQRLWRVESATAACGIAASVLFSLLAVFISDRLWETPVWLRVLFFMGGLAGAVVAHAGVGALHLHKLEEIAAFIIISPVLGFLVGMLLILIMLRVCRNMVQRKVNVAFRKLQLLSASAMAFTHGQYDAQKAMGVICLALIMYGKLVVVPGHMVAVPLWVKLGCACMMALGTASGGWRIIRTMGHKIVKLRPIHGFAAETAAALVLFTTAHLGIPVSTTHSITGAIMGVGASMNASAVRWGVAGNIFVAWELTIPCSFAIAYGTVRLIHPLFVQ